MKEGLSEGVERAAKGDEGPLEGGIKVTGALIKISSDAVGERGVGGVGGVAEEERRGGGRREGES